MVAGQFEERKMEMTFLALLTCAKYVPVSPSPAPSFSPSHSPRMPTFMHPETAPTNAHNDPPEVDAQSSIFKGKEWRLRQAV